MKEQILTEMRKIVHQHEQVVHILTHIYTLLEGTSPKSSSSNMSFPCVQQADLSEEQHHAPAVYAESELLTIKEAGYLLGVSRWTVDRMRAANKLTTLNRNGLKRLIKKEVEDAKIWYSLPKGKI